MMLSLLTIFLLVPPLLLLEGFFAGSEIALFSADKLLLKANAREGSKRAKLALELAQRPERILSTTLLMTALCVVCISALVALFVISKGYKHSDLIAVAITSPIIVLFGELIPKTLYRKYANTVAQWVAYPVYLSYWIFFPFTRLLAAYTVRLSSLLTPIEEIIAGKKRTTRDDLRAMLSYSKKETELKTVEKRMIKRIFDFKDTEARNALIPLVRVEAIEESVTANEALIKFQRHRHSRMPVYSKRIDNIIGVLEVSDLFGIMDLQQPIRNYVTPAHYIPETQSLEDLLTNMRRENDEMVVVVDEYGGAVGILTFEDIVEEIVGEINDEYDTESLSFKQIGNSSWLIQAKMEIQQINEQLHLEIPEGDYETLSGFLLQQFGRIPETGYELYFDTPHGSLKFTIRKATERHIESVLVEQSLKTT